MKELMLMLASVMPFDELVDRLTKDIEKYKADPSEDNKKGIHINCQLILSKLAIDTSGEGFEGVANMLEKMDRMEKAEKLMSPEKN